MIKGNLKNNSNDLKAYFGEIKKNNLLSSDEEIKLAKLIEKGDKVAFDKMVSCNLRLVIKIAKRYKTNEWQLPDIIQEGNIGLMKAAEKFDYRRNVRFSTYASWWIKQSIIRSIANKKRTIRLPHRKEEKLRTIKTFIAKFKEEHKKSPSIDDIIYGTGFSKKDILNLEAFREAMISIDADYNDSGAGLLNTIDDNNYSPENILEKKDLKNKTNEVLARLKKNEQEIIRSRFAFQRRKKETLKSLAEQLGISPETVRQIEIKAIKKIKQNYSYLKDYLYC